jgi:hypothetical protein
MEQQAGEEGNTGNNDLLYSLVIIGGLFGVIVFFALILVVVVFVLFRKKKVGKCSEVLGTFLFSVFPARNIFDDQNVLVETDGAFEGNYDDEELRDDHFKIDSDEEEEEAKI